MALVYVLFGYAITFVVLLFTTIYNIVKEVKATDTSEYTIRKRLVNKLVPTMFVNNLVWEAIYLFVGYLTDPAFNVTIMFMVIVVANVWLLLESVRSLRNEL